jgi:methionyl-tRNA formyltransferase
LPTDDVGTLYERLMEKGAQLVLKTIKMIENGNVSPIAQPDSTQLREAPKIFKETCEIDWSRSSGELANFIRGLSPYPAAWTHLNGKHFKIFKAKVDDRQVRLGEMLSENSQLWVGTGNGSLEIIEFQLEGKKRMLVQDFLKGNQLT